MYHHTFVNVTADHIYTCSTNIDWLNQLHKYWPLQLMSTVQILLTIQITLLSKNNHLYLYQWFCKYSSSMRFHHQQHSKHINGPRPIIRTDDSNCPRKFFRVTNERTDTRQYPCQLTGSRYPMSKSVSASLSSSAAHQMHQWPMTNHLNWRQ